MSDSALLGLLKTRFEENPGRHPDLVWAEVEKKLAANGDKLHSLSEMERTGGQPDVVGFDPSTGEYLFYDCAPETPEGRRSLCYDAEAEALRNKKGVYPSGNVFTMAAAMGIEPLDEEEYRALQALGEFDTKSSSWLKSPPDLRALGGALFGDRRYGRVFVYHNGAPSFYSGRGFRGSLRV